MKTYDGFIVGDTIRAGQVDRGRASRESKLKRLVNMVSEEFPELAAKLKPCPFCGSGFRFGDRQTFQYYLHTGRYNSRDCADGKRRSETCT